MDPFSLTVGAIALVGTAGKIIKCIEKLRRLSAATVELDVLSNEISSLQVVLTQLGNTSIPPQAVSVEKEIWLEVADVAGTYTVSFYS